MGVRPINGLELCAGIGALGLGVARALPGYRTVVAAEVEAYAVATLVARQQDGSLPPFPIWDDLTTFDGLPWRDVVDIVVAGFPCQDLSLAGKRAGIDGARSGLFFDVVRIVRDVRPRYVFLENVAAITSGRALDAVLGALAEIGFDAEWGCLRASDVGAPHRRDRWWCLAWDREQLGDAAVTRWRQVATEAQRQPRSTPDITGVPVGDPERQSLALGRCVRRDDGAECQTPERTGDALADRDGHRCPRWSQPNSRPIRNGEAQQHRNDTERRHPPLVDAGGGSLQRLGGAAILERTSRTPEGEGDQWKRCGCATGHSGPRVWPGFPPGPDDQDGWRRFLAEYPDLAPATERAVRRGADGASSRVDRLRGLGNAVVPQQAEAALRLLWYRAFGVWP